MLQDALRRPLRDLRISVTDRCNFRCTYCMPAAGSYRFLPRAALLSFEEITALARLFVRFGVRKLRLTGGEPLLRKDLPDLVAMLSQVAGIEDLALTTNGFFLAEAAPRLAAAGLQRVTVSFDSLDPETFARGAGRPVDPGTVLAAMDAAADAGLKVKVNTVVQKGVNDHELATLAQTFKTRGYTLRFIEYMDVGTVNGWDLTHVVTADEILRAVSDVLPCEPLAANHLGETARRYRYRDGMGEFGIIASVSQPFCGNCNRARLSAEGELYTCLFSARGHDLKTLLRTVGEDAVAARLTEIWGARDDRYSQLRGEGLAGEDKVEMFKIGG